PERVQHRHRPLERSLDLRIATGGKSDLPERTALRVGVVRLRCGDGESNGKGKKSNAQLHCVLPDVTRGGARTLLRGGALRKGGLDQRPAQCQHVPPNRQLSPDSRSGGCVADARETVRSERLRVAQLELGEIRAALDHPTPGAYR